MDASVSLHVGADRDPSPAFSWLMMGNYQAMPARACSRQQHAKELVRWVRERAKARRMDEWVAGPPLGGSSFS